MLRPELNAWLEAQGHRYRVDCLWRARRLVAELDSWPAHGTRSSSQSDKTRDRHLLLAGYTTSASAARCSTTNPISLAPTCGAFCR